MINIVDVFGMEVSLGLSVANLKEIQKTVRDGLKDVPAGITSTIKKGRGVDDVTPVSKMVTADKKDVEKDKMPFNFEGLIESIKGILDTGKTTEVKEAIESTRPVESMIEGIDIGDKDKAGGIKEAISGAKPAEGITKIIDTGVDDKTKGVTEVISSIKSEKGIPEAVSGAEQAGGLTEGIAGMAGNIKQMVGVLGIVAIGMAIIGKIMESVQPILAIVGNIMKMIFMPLGLMLFNFLKPVLMGMIKLMPLWFDFIKDPAGSFRALFSSLSEKASELLGNIKEVVSVKLDDLKVWIGELPGKIWNYIKELPGKMLDFWVTLPDKIWENVKGLASLVWDYVKQLLPEPIVKAVEFVSEKVVKVIDGILDMKNRFVSRIIEMKNSIIVKLLNLKDSFVNKMVEMKDGLLIKLGSLWDSITALPQQIWDKIRGLASLIAEKIKDVIPSVPSLTSLRDKFVGDAIITPRGDIIHTDPNDTLYASKNGGMGKTINVYITLDRREEDVANQIKRELITELDKFGRF